MHDDTFHSEQMLRPPHQRPSRSAQPLLSGSLHVSWSGVSPPPPHLRGVPRGELPRGQTPDRSLRVVACLSEPGSEPVCHIGDRLGRWRVGVPKPGGGGWLRATDAYWSHRGPPWNHPPPSPKFFPATGGVQIHPQWHISPLSVMGPLWWGWVLRFQDSFSLLACAKTESLVLFRIRHRPGVPKGFITTPKPPASWAHVVKKKKTYTSFLCCYWWNSWSI